jgi:NAD(P)-dependent dehydrogenase (short-subunit alcohol dehydrogenase family)
MRLEGKVAIVTGAASGIGRAIAAGFAAEGASLTLLDLDAPGLEQIAGELGGDVVTCAVDITDAHGVRAAVEKTVERYGRLDVLSHSAGLDHAVSDTLDLDPKTWQRVMDVNAGGTFVTNREAIRAMLSTGGGSIVNTVSDLGYVVVPGLSAYCASKGAALQLTRALAAEYAPRIRVNALCPTMVDTPMGRRSVGSRDDPDAYLREIAAEIPMQRIALAADLVGAAIFLASEESSYITGVSLPVDGGRTVI